MQAFHMRLLVQTLHLPSLTALTPVDNSVLKRLEAAHASTLLQVTDAQGAGQADVLMADATNTPPAAQQTASTQLPDAHIADAAAQASAPADIEMHAPESEAVPATADITWPAPIQVALVLQPNVPMLSGQPVSAREHEQFYNDGEQPAVPKCHVELVLRTTSSAAGADLDRINQNNGPDKSVSYHNAVKLSFKVVEVLGHSNPRHPCDYVVVTLRVPGKQTQAPPDDAVMQIGNAAKEECAAKAAQLHSPAKRIAVKLVVRSVPTTHKRLANKVAADKAHGFVAVNLAVMPAQQQRVKPASVSRGKLWHTAAELDKLVKRSLLSEHDATVAGKAAWNTSHCKYRWEQSPGSWTIQHQMSRADARILRELHHACQRLGDQAPRLFIGKVHLRSSRASLVSAADLFTRCLCSLL